MNGILRLLEKRWIMEKVKKETKIENVDSIQNLIKDALSGLKVL